MRGKHSTTIDHVAIFDCRFDYEYGGGHLSGAVNTPNGYIAVIEMLQWLIDMGEFAYKAVVVFHCEFGIMRSPAM
jgi:M-phase inducer tyrosine phosphatase